MLQVTIVRQRSRSRNECRKKQKLESLAMRQQEGTKNEQEN